MMVRTMTGTVNRKAIAAAIFDPGATEGLKGERTLTEWQTDAVMRALTASASEPEPVAWQSYSDISGWTVVDPDYAKHLIENGIPVRPLFVRSALPNFSSKSEEGNQ